MLAVPLLLLNEDDPPAPAGGPTPNAAAPIAAQSYMHEHAPSAGAKANEEKAREAHPTDTAAVVWLERNRRYVAKARHYAWYSPLQLLTASVLKGLAAAQTEASCLARNALTLCAVLATLMLLLVLRPRPMPSVAGWLNAVANNALLLICASLNTANAAIAGGDQRLTNAVVWVSYAAMAAAAVGTALSMARLAANTFPHLFGTQTPVAVPLLGGEYQFDGGVRGRVARFGEEEAGGLAALNGVFFGAEAAVVVGGGLAVADPPTELVDLPAASDTRDFASSSAAAATLSLDPNITSSLSTDHHHRHRANNTLPPTALDANVRSPSSAASGGERKC